MSKQKRPMSGGKKLAFTLGAVALPVAAVAVLEAALRLCGLGGYPPTLHRLVELPASMTGGTPGSVLYATDNEGPRSYFFANRARPGTLEDHALVMPKPAGTFRVFTLGESAMKGFPQPPALSSAKFLRAMLSDIWPERRIEVINLGVTAVASFPVLGILTETLAFSPDLVVVYVGNNEFFGAYGVASLHKAGASPTVMVLQRWYRGTAIGQGIDALIGKIKGPPGANQGETLMETMMGRSYTAPDDPVRGRAASNLGFFAGEMIRRCKRAGVPIIVCTLPCNERDLAPLGAFDDSGLTPAQREEIKTGLSAAQSVLAKGGTPGNEAVVAARALVDKFPGHARAHFVLGRLLESAGEFEAASVEFQRAVDLDPMPWRPPGASVQALRDAAAREGAAVCDLQAEFREASRVFERIPAGVKGGSTGWELMDDHVHPTQAGQDLVARSILRTMSTLEGPARVPAEKIGQLEPAESYAQRLGANDYETWCVAHQMRVIGKIPFFMETNPEMFARFDGVCRRLEAGWDARVREQALEWQRPETHKGAKKPLSAMVGKVLLSQNRVVEAERLYDSAVRSVFEYSSWSLEYDLYSLGCRLQLSKNQLTDADRSRARRAIERGTVLLAVTGGESGMTERHVGMLHQALGEYKESIPYLLSARRKLFEDNKVVCDAAIVSAYLKTGRNAEARALAQEGVKNSGKYAPQYQRMLDSIPPP